MQMAKLSLIDQLVVLANQLIVLANHLALVLKNYLKICLDALRQAKLSPNMNDRISKAFKDDNERKFAENYLNQLYLNSHYTEERLRKSVIRLFLLGLVSYLLFNKSINELMLGFIKINDFTLIIKLMPLLISINFYEFASLYESFQLQEALILNIIRFLHKPIYDASLAPFLCPSTTPNYVFIIAGHLPVLKKYPFMLSYMLLMFVIISSAFLMDCFIIYMCILRFGIQDLLLQIVIITSFIFFAITYLMLSSIEDLLNLSIL